MRVTSGLERRQYLEAHRKMRLFCFMLCALPVIAAPPDSIMKPSPQDDLFAAIVHVPFGAVGIRVEASTLRELVYLPRHFAEKAPVDALAEITATQIERYIADPDFVFSAPMPQVGSEFQRRVWRAIASIPRGEVRTYGDIARSIGSAPRAVGQACGANWFPLLIPCHRVTAAGGLGGFARHDDETGFHLGVKRWLLAHEGIEAYR